MAAFAVITSVIGLRTSLLEIGGFPSRITVAVDEKVDLSIGFPFAKALLIDPPDSMVIHGSAQGSPLGGDRVSFTATRNGTATLEFRLFNAIPVRRIVIEVVPQARVMAGGHSVGILLADRGVSVVGHYPITGADGRRYFPARDAGIQVGDVILSLDGAPIHDSQDLEDIMSRIPERAGPMEVELSRGEMRMTVPVDPIPSELGRGRIGPAYRLGVYVRDNAAGVGTLTFWDPSSGVFGALGHVVSDTQTGRTAVIKDGRIVMANVSGIEAGVAGRPGEKIGTFAGSSDYLGVINVNSDIGIYGVLTSPISNPVYPEPIPVAMASGVKEGPAEILTVLKGSEIERFKVEIVRVSRQSRPTGKSLVLKVTDPRLLEVTGGIVQGMSGSPIIQGGRLVGAVTHVFVSDPARGYGLLAEDMLEASRNVPIEGRLRQRAS